MLSLYFLLFPIGQFLWENKKKAFLHDLHEASKFLKTKHKAKKKNESKFDFLDAIEKKT